MIRFPVACSSGAVVFGATFIVLGCGTGGQPSGSVGAMDPDPQSASTADTASERNGSGGSVVGGTGGRSGSEFNGPLNLEPSGAVGSDGSGSDGSGSDGSGPDASVEPGDGEGAGGALGSWERIGPWNFFNEENGNGPSGTCAEAVADPTEPGTIYVGGQNNSATPGVRKSTDGGSHWENAISGLTDHSVRALRIDPAAATTIYAGTPSGVFRSADGASSWTLEAGTQAFGDVRRLVATSVAGASTLVAATGSGLAYRAFSGGGWTKSAPPVAGGVYDLAVATAPAAGPAVLFAALDDGKVYRVTMAADGVTWTATSLVANIISVDPSNPNHVLATVFPGSGLGSGDYTLIESTDGGTTVHALNGASRIFYVAFEPRDASGKTIWTGAESGVGRSTDGGKTFSRVKWQVKSKDGYVADNSQIDVQRLLMEFPGAAAFCSDQGLVQYDVSSNALASLSGDIKDAIVVSVAVSRGDAENPHVLTTMWDWGPTESWDGGQSWQATTWYGSAYWNGAGGKGAPVTGEGGQVFAIPDAADGKAHVLMHDGAQTIFLSSDGGQSFTSTELAQTANIPSDGFDYARDAAGNATGTFYLHTSPAIIQRSPDYGQTWANWGQPQWPNGTVAALAVDPQDERHVFVASGPCLTATNDGGATWSACVTPSPKRGAIRRLAIRPDDSSKLLALTAAGEIVRSTNAGASWTTVSATNAASVLSVANVGTALLSYSPNGKTALLVTAVTARPVVTPHVLSSRDDGTTWTDITQDIVGTRFNGITWDGGDAYIATSGESILRWKGLSP